MWYSSIAKVRNVESRKSQAWTRGEMGPEFAATRIMVEVNVCSHLNSVLYPVVERQPEPSFAILIFHKIRKRTHPSQWVCKHLDVQSLEGTSQPVGMHTPWCSVSRGHTTASGCAHTLVQSLEGVLQPVGVHITGCSVSRGHTPASGCASALVFSL